MDDDDDDDLAHIYDTDNAQTTAATKAGLGYAYSMNKRGNLDDFFLKSDGNPIEDQYRTGTERSIRPPDKTFNSSDPASDISAA